MEDCDIIMRQYEFTVYHCDTTAEHFNTTMSKVEPSDTIVEYSVTKVEL